MNNTIKPIWQRNKQDSLPEVNYFSTGMNSQKESNYINKYNPTPLKPKFTYIQQFYLT